jgi:YVTN family beta-propeller protein
LALALVVLASLLSHWNEAPRALPSASNSPSPPAVHPVTGALLRIDPATSKVGPTEYEVGSDPRAIAVGYGSVWVANGSDKSIVRLDPATGQVQATIAMGQAPRGIAIGGVPGVWVNTLNQVSKIDPVTNAVVLTKDLGEPSGGVASGEGSVWVTGLLGGLDRIDPATGHIDRAFAGMILCTSCSPRLSSDGTSYQPFRGGWSGDHTRGAPPPVAAGLRSVWAVSAPPQDGRSPVWRIDPATGSSSAIRVPFAPAAVTVGENAVWAVGTDGEMARIDRTGRITTVFQATGRGAAQLAFGFDAVWVLNPIQGTLTRIDPATYDVVATIHVNGGASDIAAGGGWVWVTEPKASPLI